MLLRSFLSLYNPEQYDNNSYPILYPSTPISKKARRMQPSPSVSSYHDMHSLVASLTTSPVQIKQEIIDATTGIGSSQSIPFRAYLTLIFGLLFQISLGALWTYGNVIPYIASYITYKSPTIILNQNVYHHYYSLTNWSFFLLFTALTFGVLLGGKVEIYFGPKIAILISSIFVTIGFGATFIALSLNSIYAVLLTYGVLFGFGIGLGYPILTIVCMRWFPNTRGRVCGIISGVFGGSPLLWDYVQTYIVNPNGIPIDPLIGYANSPTIIDRIPFMFLYIGMIQCAMQILACLIVTNPPWYIPERDQKSMTDDRGESESGSSKDKKNVSQEQTEYELHSLTMKMTLRLPTFWALWINNFLYSFVLMWVAAEWKEFAMICLRIDSDSYLAIIGSISALMNGIGRFGWGFIYDMNRSFRISMGTMTFIVAIAISTLPLINVWNIDSRIFFAIWIFVIWICVGCQYAFLPTCIAETFGAKYTGSIVGLFVWCEAPSSLLVVLSTQFYQELFKGWNGYCLFIASCSFVSFILSMFYKSNIDREKIINEYNEKEIDENGGYGDEESIF